MTGLVYFAAVLCAEVVDNGKISNTTCLRHDGEECETLCDNGYSPVLSKIKCVNGAWNVTDNCRKGEF